jgi:hypothetical protein
MAGQAAVSRLYYVGQPIIIEFKVGGISLNFGAATTPVALSAAGAEVFDSQGNPISNPSSITCEGLVVTLRIPPFSVQEIGDYTALFKLVVNGKEKNVPIYFAVVSKELLEEAKSLRVSALTEESSEHEVDAAINQDIRADRKEGSGKTKIIYNAAQVRTGKRVQK